MFFTLSHDLFSYERNSLTRVFRKAYGERRLAYLFLEQIFFVEEQDDAGVGEPLVVADRIEQL